MTTPVLRGSTAPLPGRPDGTPFGQNTLQATAPDTTLVGDLVLAVTWHGTPSATGSALTLRSGEGWTQLINYFHDDGTNDGAFGVAWKIATLAGAQVYQAFDDTGGYEWADCRTALRVYEVGTFDVSGILASTPASLTDGNLAPDPSARSGLDAARDYLIEAIGCWWHTADLVNCVPGAPTGYSNLIETVAGGWLELALSNKAVSGATSEDPATYTDNVDSTNNAGTVGATVAILGAAGTARRAIIGWDELEVPDPPTERRAIIGWDELEVPNQKYPDSLSFLFHPTWSRYRYQASTPSPDTERRAIIGWDELEVPDVGRRAIISWDELEVPLPSGALLRGIWNDRPYTSSLPPWESFTGAAVEIAMDFVGHASWTAFDNSTWIQPWGTWLNAQAGRKFMISIAPIVSGSGFTHAQVAAGAANSHYQGLADDLAGWGLLGDANHEVFLRIGWEMDGVAFAWRSALSSPETWAAMYRNMRTVMNARQPTNQWKWGICFVNNYTAISNYLNRIWPGDAEVDWVGDDVYDQSWVTNTYPYPVGATEAEKQARRVTAWNAMKSKLDTLIAFLNTKGGRPFMFPEWGCINRSGDGHGGLDNPYFIEQMYNFMTNPANNCIAELYFTTLSSDPNITRIHPTTQFPNASAKFLQLFFP